MNPIKSYTLSTFRKLCDSIIPETPELSLRYGDEQIPGAESVDLEESLYAAFNNLAELNGPPYSWLFSRPPTVPLSPAIALLLDGTALEYILRQKPEDDVEPQLGTGPYGWLSQSDRRAVIDFMDEESFAKTLNQIVDAISPYSGFFRYLIRGMTSVPVIAYYSEWSGYEQSGGKLIPKDSEFSGTVQSWSQTGFPGLEDGYADFLGYELEHFEENDY